ncbi:MAG: PA2779 family protein [Sulfuritalea sp.]|nr:PA2779 family protein [Sulfuritalea sp.]MDP1983125.1 PA2779 family protein [Sulfuritalea sp.]
MNSTFKKLLCRFLAVALITLPFQTGQAAMIGTDQVTSAASVQADRTLVSSYLSRAQTVSEFQALGIDAKDARDRVAAMTDAEIGALAGQINALPVGGDGLVALVLVVFIIWYFAFRK